MEVTLVPADHEVEEPRNRPGLAFDGRPGLAALPPEPRQKPVCIGLSRTPHGLANMSHELQDRGPLAADVTVCQTGAHHRQGKLINDLLLEVLDFDRGLQASGRVQGADNRERHQGLAYSTRSTTSYGYHGNVENLDNASKQGTSLARSPTPRDAAPQASATRNELVALGAP